MKLNERKAWFVLSLILTPGMIGIDALTERYPDPAELYEALISGSDKYIPHQLTAAAKAFDMQLAEDITGYCERRGIDIITRDDERYPEKFREVECPPLAFYCFGDHEVLNEEMSLTVVGARNSTEYSRKVAAELSRGAAAEGYVIISGFARGIDSAAHEGALEAGGKTVAVLGCGIDYDYPRGQGQLKEAISQNGAVISEYPPLAQADKSYFTIRNRMIAGLGKAVLVVQAGVKSGSINTATHALSQGKDILVIPPCDIFAEEFEGQSNLLRDGAIPVCSLRDLMFNI